MKIVPMELIVLSLFILVSTGILYNNFISVASANTQLFLDPNPPSGTYSFYNGNTGIGDYNGCSVAICSVSSPSFLNPNSPFTYLIQGDILGFVGSFTTNQQQAGPTGNFIQATCTIQSGTNASVTAFKCGALSFTSNNDQFWPNFPYTFFTSSTGNNSEWFCTNCLSSPSGTQIIPIQFYGAYNIHTLSGGSCGVNSSVYCLFNLNSANLKYYTSSSQSSVTTNCSGQPGVACTTSSQSLTNAFSFFGFIIGILLLIMGLQLSGGGSITFIGGFSFGIGDYGARLCQVIGIGLLVWLPMYSEFGYWLTGPYLGLGLGTIVLTILTVLFFVGTWWEIENLVG